MTQILNTVYKMSRFLTVQRRFIEKIVSKEEMVSECCLKSESVFFWNCLEKIGLSRLWNPCHTKVASLQRFHSVSTAFKKLQNAEVRAVQTPATLYKRCGNAVQSPRSNARWLLSWACRAFPQRVRQQAVATLWCLLEHRGRVVSAPRARCKDFVTILHLE